MDLGPLENAIIWSVVIVVMKPTAFSLYVAPLLSRADTNREADTFTSMS